MGEVNYAPIIQEMTWSYSRIKAFDDCHYRWYLQYIRRLHGKDMFFASYGSFMHKLIELYYKEDKMVNSIDDMELTVEMVMRYLRQNKFICRKIVQ